jgi:RNA polymerase sigma-70 factor (ECF subfamily)
MKEAGPLYLVGRALETPLISQAEAEARTGAADADSEGTAARAAPRWRLEQYRDLLMVMVRKAGFAARLRNQEDCSDIVQSAMVRALKALPDFRGQTEAELIRWLQVITKHTFIDKLRRADGDPSIVSICDVVDRSSARIDDFLEDRKNPSPSENAERGEFLMRLAGAVEQLPDRQRDAFILKVLMGNRVVEVAKLLDVTRPTVVGLLDRSLQRLRELLPDYQREAPPAAAAPPAAGSMDGNIP